MNRNHETLRDTVFDLLVIGGGIQGAVICQKATQRGLRVALVEKNDFCGSSSSNSLKILHGGLRYLQNFDFRRMRDSIRSRREMMGFAPHLVQPLPCILPAYGHGLKGREFMRIAMLINDIVSHDRNAGLPGAVHLPAGHTLSKAQCVERAPGISTEKLLGASVWYDALATNTERLVLEYILQAADKGAQCFNYLGVESLNEDADTHLKAVVRDQLSNKTYEIQARNVINSAGAAFEDLQPEGNNNQEPVRWARGLNIVIRKSLFDDSAVALEKKFDTGKRMLFLVPWRNHYTLIGTHYREAPRSSTLLPVSKQDIMALVDDANTVYPAAAIRFEDVSYYHAGLLPMRESSPQGGNAEPTLAKESTIIDHDNQGGSAHFFSIQGIKYTTAPRVADKVLDKFAPPPAHSDSGKSETAHKRIATQSEQDTCLAGKYGERYLRVKAYVEAEPEWLDDKKSLRLGELNYYMQEEMALHLSDVVFRRSDIGTAECPSTAVLEKICQLMAQHYDWDSAQKSMELEQVLQRYNPLNKLS